MFFHIPCLFFLESLSPSLDILSSAWFTLFVRLPFEFSSLVIVFLSSIFTSVWISSIFIFAYWISVLTPRLSLHFPSAYVCVFLDFTHAYSYILSPWFYLVCFFVCSLNSLNFWTKFMIFLLNSVPWVLSRWSSLANIFTGLVGFGGEMLARSFMLFLLFATRNGHSSSVSDMDRAG